MIHNRHASQGKFLFTYRSYLPVAFIPFLAYYLLQVRYPYGSHNLQHAWEFACCGLSLLGMVVRILTIGFVADGTSGRNAKRQRASVLNTTGMYSICRNPLYVGNLLIWLGIVAYPRDLTLALLFVTAFWLYYERIVAAEEAFLLNKFKQPYQDWCNKTPVFVPNFRLWTPPELGFCVRMVLRREYTTLFAIGVGFFLLDVTSHVVVENLYYVEYSWTSFAIFCTVQYLILRTLKRHTNLLTPLNRPGKTEEHLVAPPE